MIVDLIDDVAGFQPQLDELERRSIILRNNANGEV